MSGGTAGPGGHVVLLQRSFPPVALSKAYEHHIGKALPTCTITKNSLFTALVNCKARMVSCQYVVSHSQTSLIWAVHQTLLPARVWLRETSQYDSILCCSWPVVMITES